MVTARDLGSQLLAAWAGSVEAGRSMSFAKFRTRVMDPAREHDQAQRFWAGQDLGGVLERWAHAVRRPGRVHVIVLAADDPDPHQTIWTAVGEIVGFDAAALPLTTVAAGPDATGIAVLRSVNRAVDGRLDTRTQRTVVRRYVAEGANAQAVTHAAVPADLHEALLETGETWRKQLAEGGYDVHGDTTALLPGPVDPEATLPDDVPLDDRLSVTTDALADVLVEVARLREHNEALQSRNAKLEKKRKKLKRRLADAG